MESLAFGTHLIIDGFQADHGRLQSVEALREFLVDAIAKVDPHGPVKFDTETLGTGRVRGLTGAALKAESHVVIHLYPATNRLSLDIFSRRAVLLSGLATELQDHFHIGRFESHLRHLSKPIPLDEGHLLKALAGDRMYAYIRLEDILRE
jgi:S-adenosylmethionine decarboxylase